MSDSETISEVGIQAASPQTAGAMLRAARERAGLHVAALAVAMKIPVRKLEALEADQLQAVEDVVFTRALASSVCRALKIDPKPVLAALPQSKVRELHVDDNGINAPFASAAVGGTSTISVAFKQPWVLLVIVLVAAALAMGLSGLWDRSDSSPMQTASPTVADEPVAQQMPGPVVIPAAQEPESKADASVMNAVSSQASASAPKADTANATALASLPVVGMAATSSSASAAASAPVVASAAAPGSELIMGFRAKQNSVWVEVIDAKGDVRLRRNVAAGEKVECGGIVPLSVVIGRADSVEVEVRGRPFSIQPYARENVARFEVK